MVYHWIYGQKLCFMALLMGPCKTKFQTVYPMTYFQLEMCPWDTDAPAIAKFVYIGNCH